VHSDEHLKPILKTSDIFGMILSSVFFDWHLFFADSYGRTAKSHATRTAFLATLKESTLMW
jgi:hypothetical protein